MKNGAGPSEMPPQPSIFFTEKGGPFLQTLQTFFEAHPVVAVALSGGVDSTYLFYEASRYAKQVHGYFLETPFQPARERRDVERIAALVDAPVTVLSKDVLADAAVAENGSRRCYWCKRSLFSCLCEAAAKDGFSVVLDGTNASDDITDRPGMQALEEFGVLSPLRLCGMTKAKIRASARAAGLFTADKPAYACLATRVPTGEPITYAALQCIEQAEDVLDRLGFSDYRVRLYHGAARIQLPESQLARAIELRQEILTALHPSFEAVLLDLQPRT